jgi:opacity protein-like surface antigen
MRKKMIVQRISSVGLLGLVLAGVPGPAQGQGWYLGSELGAHVVPDLGLTGLSNDRASVCDEFINPQYATVTQTAGYEAYNCTGPDRRDNWVNQFARATGLQASWVLGYRFGADASGPRWRHVRTELEYFYRATTYDQTVTFPGLSGGSGIVAEDKLNQELQKATDYLGRVTSHTLFANLYWEVRTPSGVTPYVGAGAGIGRTAVSYGSLWARNAKATAITTGEGLPNVDEIRQNLAGTASSFQGILSDNLVVSQQVLLGVNFAVTEGLSVGVKGRWVHVGAFESPPDSFVWDPLRSHVPNVRRDGSEPVTGQILTDGSTLWGVGLSLTYHL